MAKGKSKNKKTNKQLALVRVPMKRRAARPNRALISSGRAGLSMQNPALDVACSLADPFACSSCIPDGSTGTGCFTLKQEGSFSTGAGGSCNFFAFNPQDLTAWQYSDTASINATPTVTGSWVRPSQIASITSFYGAARCVSAGIRVSYIGNTQTDGGVIMVGAVNGNVLLNQFNGITQYNAASLMKEFRTYPLRNGAKICWRPDNAMDMLTWSTVSGSAKAVSASSAQGAPYMVAIVFSANASQATMFVEYVGNYEGQIVNNTFAASGSSSSSSTAPIEAGWYEKARTMIKDVPAIAPFIASGAVAAARAGIGYYTGGIGGLLGSLANGLPAPGLLDSGLSKGPKGRPLLLTNG